MTGRIDPEKPILEPIKLSGPRRILLICAGLFFVTLAMLGFFLPILPTTPFALLASLCFVRSSPRLHRWLLRNRLVGPFLHDWHRHRGVKPRVKVAAIGLLIIALGISGYLVRESIPLVIGLGALGLIGLVVVAWLPVIDSR